VITAGVDDGSFKCDDPAGSAWRLNCLIDGLAVQLMVHDKAISRRQAADWMRLGAPARSASTPPTSFDCSYDWEFTHHELG
jgi:hypothetical protein